MSIRSFIKKFVFILGERSKKIYLFIFFFLISSFLDLLSIGLVGPYIALVTDAQKMRDNKYWTYFENFFDQYTNNQILIIIGLIIITAFIFKNILSYVIYKKIIFFSYDTQKHMQRFFLKKYQSMTYLYHSKRNSSSIINSISSYIPHFCNNLMVSAFRLISEVMMLISLTGMLLYVNWLATISFIIFFTPLYLLYNNFTKARIIKSGELLAEANSNIIKNVNQSISGLKEIKVMGKEKYFRDELFKSSVKATDAAKVFNTLQVVPRFTLEAIIVSFIIMLSISFILFQSERSFLIVTLGTFGLAAVRMMPAYVTVISGINNIVNSFYIVDQLYNDTNDLKNKNNFYFQNPIKNEKNKHSFKTKIELKKVKFKYPQSSKYAINIPYLSVKKGEYVGIVGQSGSGKTTLVDLIIGMHKIDIGLILVDGLPIYKNLRSWMNSIAYIPQDIFLLDDSVLANIAMGSMKSEIDNKLIDEAVIMASLKNMISDLPDGIHTVIGEKGSKISGGQRQRIALARAFYNKRDIIILDEATSALDDKIESIVVDSIQKLKGEKTIIVIAHRTTTLKNCDKIYKIDSGKIVQSGDYNSILNN
tara:strand:- start:34009 stop:35781 length:1773 start_codon:yes stop_codon:yes gene_type:complete